jgi:anti-sigma regulatory factor (Ser/Thr protein kinase)
VVIRAPYAGSDAPRVRLPAVAASVPDARRFAYEVLAPRIADETVLYDAQLLTCELASNAVKHAPSGEDRWIEVMAEVEDQRVVTISVSDPGRGFDPADRYDPPPDSSGWGLVIVSRVASRWGAWPGQRFTVWAEIDLLPA